MPRCNPTLPISINNDPLSCQKFKLKKLKNELKKKKLELEWTRGKRVERLASYWINR